ncbi:MAG: class I SAM-dependent methyltransferase [Gammaproteobacteria bacterium]|nr:class I SAM-dependent methyltransferase [Gammaproteobacteria bacterium]MDH4256870.1 class I SAM-dependent methyltransferase [Gammaproteobacteria bacterium]MDH5311457.1 class I SAM-dependent methyltransferase [Gammaproteobacteria bacterium]
MPLFKRTLSEFLFRRFMLKHYASNLLVDMNLEAKHQTFEYIKAHMIDAPYFEKHDKLVAYALTQATKPGLYLEFGVGRGKSMRWIAPRVQGTVHGFDSFEGIPEHWNGNPIGAFAQKKLPKVPSNVEFHIGLFGDTLPEFMQAHAGPVAFLHVDCDLYSSTVTVFEHLGPRLQPGAILLFDEYYNFHRWQQHEFKAFQEFVAGAGIRYEYIGYSVTGQQVVVRLLENPVFQL